jgi:hypothetical protein
VVAWKLTRTLGWELYQRRLNFAPDPANGDPEDPLPTLNKINHFIGGRAFVDACPIAHQRDPTEVLDASVPKVLDGLPDLLEGYSRVQQPFDDLQYQDVAERVQALTARTRSATDGRLD